MRSALDLTLQQAVDEVAFWRGNAAATIEMLMAHVDARRRAGENDQADAVNVNFLWPQVAALGEALRGRCAEEHCDEGCGKAIVDGDWVYGLEDGGEIHCNCEQPQTRPLAADAPDGNPDAFQHQDHYSEAEVERVLTRAAGYSLGFAAEDDAEVERTCRVCGCTQDRACETPTGPCHWVALDLCSAPACVATSTEPA